MHYNLWQRSPYGFFKILPIKPINPWLVLKRFLPTRPEFFGMLASPYGMQHGLQVLMGNIARSGIEILHFGPYLPTNKWFFSP